MNVESESALPSMLITTNVPASEFTVRDATDAQSAPEMLNTFNSTLASPVSV